MNILMAGKFEVGDRVKAWYEGKWYSGQVYSFEVRRTNVISESLAKLMGCEPKTKECPDLPPVMIIKTDEKVDDAPDAILGGHGLRNRDYVPEDSIFLLREDEVEVHPQKRLEEKCGGVRSDEGSDDFFVDFEPIEPIQ